MTPKFGYEPMIRLHAPQEQNVFIEVSSDGDIPEFLNIATTNPESKEYYGAFSMSMSTEQARQLARAILSVADQLDANPV